MLNTALKFKEFFLNLFKILALIAFCLAVGFAVVFPLWKFAVCAPRIYTIVVLSVIFAVAVFCVVRKILRKKNES